MAEQSSVIFRKSYYRLQIVVACHALKRGAVRNQTAEHDRSASTINLPLKTEALRKSEGDFGLAAMAAVC
jgi:hypothetical protein